MRGPKVSGGHGPQIRCPKVSSGYGPQIRCPKVSSGYGPQMRGPKVSVKMSDISLKFCIYYSTVDSVITRTLL